MCCVLADECCLYVCAAWNTADALCAGLAITLEHNFMMSAMGMQNFESQIKQVVQSIQTTNDLDVHQALLTAPSYQNKVRESYYVDQYIHKALQDYKDNFGFVQVRTLAHALARVHAPFCGG